MKKASFLKAVTLLGIVMFGYSSFAQSSSEEFDKKTLLNSASVSADADKLALENIKSISDRMFRDFTTRFQGATNIKVNQVDNCQMISCYTGTGFNRIMYNKKGRWQHTVRTYDNDKLPEDVREHIEYVYPRFSIFGGVIEVHVGDKTAYLVSIEDKKSWKRIRVVDGQSDVYEEYKKL